MSSAIFTKFTKFTKFTLFCKFCKFYLFCLFWLFWLFCLFFQLWQLWYFDRWRIVQLYNWAIEQLKKVIKQLTLTLTLTLFLLVYKVVQELIDKCFAFVMYTVNVAIYSNCRFCFNRHFVIMETFCLYILNADVLF